MYSYPHQQLLLSFLKIIVILMGVKYYLITTLIICIFLVTKDVEHLCLLAICVPFFLVNYS